MFDGKVGYLWRHICNTYIAIYWIRLDRWLQGCPEDRASIFPLKVIFGSGHIRRRDQDGRGQKEKHLQMLHAKIGQITVERGFLAEAWGKRWAWPTGKAWSSLAMRSSVLSGSVPCSRYPALGCTTRPKGCRPTTWRWWRKSTGFLGTGHPGCATDTRLFGY